MSHRHAGRRREPRNSSRRRESVRYCFCEEPTRQPRELLARIAPGDVRRWECGTCEGVIEWRCPTKGCTGTALGKQPCTACGITPVRRKRDPYWEEFMQEILEEMRRLYARGEARSEERHHEQLLFFATLRDGESVTEAARRILE
jgi:hypothetical protein